ncbi:MAG: hypothetical protein ACK521_10875, partial [bacterium]
IIASPSHHLRSVIGTLVEIVKRFLFIKKAENLKLLEVSRLSRLRVLVLLGFRALHIFTKSILRDMPTVHCRVKHLFN